MEIEGIRKRKLRKEKRRKADGERVRGVGKVSPAVRKGGGEVIEDGTKKKKKKRRIGEESDVPDGAPQFGGDSGCDLQDANDKGKKARRKKSNMSESDHASESNEMEINNESSSIGKPEGSKVRLEKAKIKKRKGLKLLGEAEQKIAEPVEAEVHNISSGDEDCSKGMKKWVSEYHQRRPGLKELQQRIDEFIVAHEAKLEQERKEREERAAEGGWTVVTHHKGRKKTTEVESGVVVGSVSQAATEEKMAKKKRKEVGLDFYRFQRKEAQRNELMMLQSKFEQDKKRIQELRAARKFRPF